MVLPVSRLVIVTKPVSHAHMLGIFSWQVERSGSILLIQDQAIAAGYHNGSGVMKGDANLAASHIKSGWVGHGDDHSLCVAS